MSLYEGAVKRPIMTSLVFIGDIRTLLLDEVAY